MMKTTGIQAAIQSELIRQGPCTLQVLLDRLPQFSWSEMFAAIDRLSRDGNLILRHPSQFEYELSVSPYRTPSEQAAKALNVEDDPVASMR